MVAERLQRFSQQFFITIRPVLCTIHFGRVKKVYPISTASVNSSVILHLSSGRQRQMCIRDSSCVALKKRFSLLSEHICSIFLLFSSKSKNGNILLDIIEVRCSGNDREISLNMPAKNYLDGRFTMYLGYLSDDRLNNAPLDIAPPNRNQQVM